MFGRVSCLLLFQAVTEQHQHPLYCVTLLSSPLVVVVVLCDWSGTNVLTSGVIPAITQDNRTTMTTLARLVMNL